MIYARVILDGESFDIRIDEASGKREGEHSYYPLKIRHEASGYSAAITCKSIQLAEVFADPRFAEELTNLYYNIFDHRPTGEFGVLS